MQPGNPPPADDPYGQQSNQPPYPGSNPPPGSGQPYPSAPPPGSGYGGAPPSEQNNTLGLLGMIFGIAGIVFAFLCGLFGLPVPIAGIVLGALGMKRVSEGRATNRGMALTGVITGAIGVVIAIVAVIIGAAMLSTDS
jgi:hypothetical protein